MDSIPCTCGERDAHRLRIASGGGCRCGSDDARSQRALDRADEPRYGFASDHRLRVSVLLRGEKA